MRPGAFTKVLLLAVILFVLLMGGCSKEKEFAMSLDGTWLFKVDSLGTGVKDEWFRKGLDRSDWTSVHVPDYWDRYNLAASDGPGWFATTIHVGDSSTKQVIFFAGVDDDAEIWLDGQTIGSHIGYGEPFYVPLPPNISPGRKELVVRVDDHKGPGGIYKPVSLVPQDRVPEMFRTKYADVHARPSADWIRDAVIYEVYLRSFSPEGTFSALEHRLPELKKLGVTVLWLMPIHPVGELNRKGVLGSPYAVQDYYAVNPRFGSLEDFKSLVEAVHEQGLKILLDLVADHTSWDSQLIMEHPDWFVHNSDGAIVSPNAEWSDVAALNYGNHELRKYMIEMMKYWVRDVGIDGYRCDAAELVPTEFWERARKELESIKPVMMISEGTLPEHHVAAFDVTYSWTMYDVLPKIMYGSTPATVLDDILKTESYQYPVGALRLRFTSNHDKNTWDAPAALKYTPDGAKAAALLAFCYPGIPLVYNGDETGSEVRLSLFNKVPIDWSGHPDIRSFYEALTKLRREHAPLRMGEFVPVQSTDRSRVYSFLRRSGDDVVVVVVNLSPQPKSVIVDLPSYARIGLVDYFTRHPVAEGDSLPMNLDKYGFRVFVPSLNHGDPSR